MKIGDRVYVVSDQVSLGNGTAGEITTLNDAMKEVGVRFSTGPAVFTVKAWDLLPARLYTQSALKAVYQMVQDMERERDSILCLSRGEIVQKIVDHGLLPPAASRCTDLFDPADWKSGALPLQRWLTRIRDFYYPQNPAALATSGKGAKTNEFQNQVSKPGVGEALRAEPWREFFRAIRKRSQIMRECH